MKILMPFQNVGKFKVWENLGHGRKYRCLCVNNNLVFYTFLLHLIMSEKTIFKRIIDKEIPAQIVYEDDLCMAFKDVNPQAPVHILLIPKKEIASTEQLTEEDTPLLGHLYGVLRKLVQEFNLQEGYRVVTNCGQNGGQTVYHLHFHLLGGRPLLWPPG